MTFDALLTQLRKNAAEIDKIAQKLGIDLGEVMHPEITKLNNCLDTYSAFKVLVATIVNDAQGKWDLNKGIAITSNFDKNWDAFAKEYNEIFNGLDNEDQANILETFAKEQFGINVFNAGSVLKNETPNILSGIAGFKAGVNSFKGSYRNPIDAANKIRNGVNAIVHSTEAIARSANKIVGALKQFKNPEAKGSVVLDKLSNLSAYKPVSFALDAVNKAAGAVNIAGNLGSGFGNATNALNALKKGDLKGAAASAKSAADNVKNIKAEIQAMRGKGETPTGSGLSDGKGAEAKSGNPSAENESEGNNNQENSNQNKDKEDKDSDKGSSDSYVCSTAKIKCTNGDKISTLTVFPTRTIWLTGQPQANISDHIPMQNIAPFGRCHTTAYPPTAAATAAAHGKLTPMPCVPNTPFPWMGGKNDVLLQNQPALLKSSKCKCIYGGTITITFDGQTAGTGKDVVKENLQTQEELDAETNVSLSAEDLLDGLQMALDAAGMVPGFGAVPDLLNACISACRGDWANAGLSLFAAIPGIGDAAGAAKLMKNGAKIAQKSKKLKAVNKLEGMETMSEAIAKGPNRELAAARAKRMGVNPNETSFGSHMDSAPMHSQQKHPFGDLTKRDRFEIEEAKAIDNIHKSEEPSKILPGMIKDPAISTSKSVPEVVKSKPSDVIQGKEIKSQTTKRPDVKVDPKVYKYKDKPILGKNLDIQA